MARPGIAARSNEPARRGSLTTAGPISVRIAVAAEMLGIGRTKLYELIGSGDIDRIKVGKVSLIPVRALEEFVEKHRAACVTDRSDRAGRRGRPPASFVTLVR